MADLPQMRRKNTNADTRTYGIGGFSSILPEVQVYLRDPLQERKNGRNQNARRLDAVQTEITGLYCVCRFTEFYIAGADAAACIKSTCYNMTKSGYTVHVFSDCITSYDKKKLPELLAYYESKGCSVMTLQDAMQA